MSLTPELSRLRDEVLTVTSCADWADRQGWPLRRLGGELVGSCPVCGGSDRFAINPQRDVWNCRGCGVGGDVIFLVQHTEGLKFVAALEVLAGRSAAERRDPAEEARQREAREAAEARRADEAARYREKARRDAWTVWRRSMPPHRHPDILNAYFSARGLAAATADLEAMPIRVAAARAFWHEGAEIHRGPAMIAAIQQPDGRFGGVHQTWLDPAAPRGKATIAAPDGKPLPAKKVLGLKKGCAIRLVRAPAPRRLVMGEGIETTLTAFVAERDKATEYWAGIDRGNMSGKALRLEGRIVHDQPEMGDEGCFLPPDWCAELVYLCDGDEPEQHTVEKVTRGLRRARRRRDQAIAGGADLPPLATLMVPPGPPGTDLNSLLTEAVED